MNVNRVEAATRSKGQLATLCYSAISMFKAVKNIGYVLEDFNFLAIISAAFWPDFNMPPKMGPIRGKLYTAQTDMPAT